MKKIFKKNQFLCSDVLDTHDKISPSFIRNILKNDEIVADLSSPRKMGLLVFKF